MAGDYTRMTFRPRKDHAGVLMQQGRVTLDADFNELVELIDRRLRAETIDIIGRCTVPSETPDGFLVQVTGGTLTIGPGRAYVHGLLAENHGAEPDEYDPILGEVRGTAPVDYAAQPYLPNPDPLPTGGTHVAYLDVWQREVTHLEDAELVEKAIAVDTATRLQTAWQVKLLEAPEGTECTSELPAWADLIAPSAGRLTTQAVGVPTADDPCTIPPAGGYRGTENRLYRVEIHDGGPLGTATWKWSRDNASIASAVTGIDAARTELTLVRLGRDGVRRIRIDDWVEVTDDWRELHGLPGELRKVADVDEVRQAVVLASPLPAGAFDAAAPERHTRIRRWDQAGVAVDAANGAEATPAGPVVLEDGVEIEFGEDPAGGSFHALDYWVFAARTADASVEELVAAPPRGILHHYCRLAVVTFPDGATDCRTLWPPPFGEGGCDCDACVTPESHASGALTIQHAIDTVKATGGKVCLHAGVYRLEEPLRISGAVSLHLQGRGWATILVATGTGPAIIVQASVDVRIDDLTVVTAAAREGAGASAGIAIGVLNALGVDVDRCVLLQLGSARTDEGLEGGLGTMLFSALAERVASAPLIVLSGIVGRMVVRDNVFLGATGVGALVAAVDEGQNVATTAFVGATRAAAVDGGIARLFSFGLEISDNLMLCSRAAVDLGGFTLLQGDTTIARNTAYGSRLAGIIAAGLVGAGGKLDVIGNVVRPLGIGIFVAGDDTRVVDNDVVSLGEESTDGIVLGGGFRRAGVARLQVLSNRVLSMAGAGIAIRSAVRSALVKQNLIEGVGEGGIVMDDGASAETITIENNQLLRVAATSDHAEVGAYAIRVLQSRDVAVVGNTVAGVAQSAVRSRERVGIDVVQCETIRVSGNRLVDVGPLDEFVRLGAGIAVRGPFNRADLSDNTVCRTRFVPQDPGRSEWYGLVVAELVAQPTRSFLFVAIGASLFAFGLDTGFARSVPRGQGTLGVRGNTLEAFGGAPAAQILTDGACVFGENRCLVTAFGGVQAARITAGAIVASGNYLEGPGEGPAFDLNPGTGRFTVLGNVCSGPIRVAGNPLGGPWDSLNAVA